VTRVHNRLLVPTVLRPFGEHLADIAQPRTGDVCVHIGDDGGVMAALLSRTAAVCVAVDDDPEALAEMHDEMAMLGRNNVIALRADSAALPLPDGCAQVVTSLFTLAFEQDPAAALREMLRVLDPQRGRLAVALWSEPSAVPHLDALLPASQQAVDRATAYGYELAAERLVEQAGGTGRVGVARIHDVVRFDGAAHWWAATAEALGADASMRAVCEQRLQPYAAVDGTLRIPTEAVVLTTAPA
jgi:SAM-dependent methyltransferase